MTALEYFRLFAKEFDNLDDTAAQKWLDTALLFASLSSLTDEQKAAAQALYAAHLAWIEKNQGNGGGVRGAVIVEEDAALKLRRSYGHLQDSNTLLGISPYGQQYMQLTLPISGACIMTRFGV